MEKYFCNYNQSLALKKLGFDIPVNTSWVINKMYPQGIIGFGSWINHNSYNDHLSAPLKSQVFEFFRDKYSYDVTIKKITKDKYQFIIELICVKDTSYHFVDYYFDSHNEAESACINKLIELVKKK